MRFFKRNNFCIKIRFFQAQHAISDSRFFKDRCFFYATFLKFVFIEAPLFFTRNQTFCERKGFFDVFGPMRLTGVLHQKIFGKFRKILFLNSFFKGFSVEKDVFLRFPVGEEWFSRLRRIPSGIFWGCKIAEILTLSFYPWLSVWYCLFNMHKCFQNFKN